MNLELDHVFILTENPKEAGDLLVYLGLEESFSRDHKGQGTSNRRFLFSNGMLELLYIRDKDESLAGPAKGLNIVERIQKNNASPFGIVLTRTDNMTLEMPFNGWKYQPDYFEPPNAFHIGDNSSILEEPLCIYVPFMNPIKRKEEIGLFKFISKIEVFVPQKSFSNTLLSLQSADRLEVKQGREHLVNITLDNGRRELTKDLRNVLPLIINW